VDLKCSERDKERLSAKLKELKIQSIEAEFELAALKRDNQELHGRFSQQEVRLQLAAQLPSSGQDYQVKLNSEGMSTLWQVVPAGGEDGAEVRVSGSQTKKQLAKLKVN